jgi:3'-5' exoribonuclease
LKHILLSHHGETAYGSPKTPQTAEAYLVHLIDLMDSKMGAISAVKKGDRASGKWSGYIKHLDGIVFKDTLPHYSSYISDDSSAKSNVKKGSKDNLTHSLADKLSGFKVDT